MLEGDEQKKKETQKVNAPYLGRTGDLPIPTATVATEFFSRTLVPTELKKQDVVCGG